MLRPFGISALLLIVIVIHASWAGEPATSSGPPAWQDGASIYLNMHDSPVASTKMQRAADTDNRRLPPPSGKVRADYRGEQAGAENNAGSAADVDLPLKTVYTVVSALAIAIGTFLLCAWVLKRGGRITVQTLPAEVVSVLGRVTLEPRQFAQLLRVGNKVVLISLTPNGAETLTEVTDPVEVDRIVGLCQQSQPHSTTKAFEQVLQQLSREPASSGFLGNSMAPTNSVPSLDMFRPQLGEASRA
jgi:flagellar biogenesis protein FliO